jgi:hypothetical protein
MFCSSFQACSIVPVSLAICMIGLSFVPWIQFGPLRNKKGKALAFELCSVVHSYMFSIAAATYSKN